MLQQYIKHVINEAKEQNNIFVKTPLGGEELIKRIAAFSGDSKEYAYVKNHNELSEYSSADGFEICNMRVVYEDAIISRLGTFDNILFNFMPNDFIDIYSLDNKFIGGLVFSEYASRVVVTLEMANRLLKVCKTGKQFTELLRRFGTKI